MFVLLLVNRRTNLSDQARMSVKIYAIKRQLSCRIVNTYVRFRKISHNLIKLKKKKKEKYANGLKIKNFFKNKIFDSKKIYEK